MQKSEKTKIDIANVITNDLVKSIRNLIKKKNNNELKIVNIRDLEMPKPNTQWGNWHLNEEFKCIDFIDPEDNYLLYEFDLENLDNNEPNTIWRQIHHIALKSNVFSDNDIADLIKALSELVGYKGYWNNENK